MNVQQTIIKGIRELLFTHNYLVLPNFGGFVLKANPAHTGSSGTLLLPASKTVSFNAQLRQNDGILTLWLQEKLSCPATEALQHLHDFAAFCSSILTARRRLTLERIGFFYLDFENNICFEPQADSNFLTESFGLGPVSIRELEVPVAAPRREPVFADRTVSTVTEPAPKATRRYNYRRLVVPALLSALFFSLLLVFVSGNRFSGQLRASVLGPGAGNVYQPVAYAELSLLPARHKTLTYVADANGIATLEVGHNKLLAVKVLDATVSGPVNHATRLKTRRTGNFEIVLGCFTILENASRMAASLADHNVDADISGRNEKGMYIVSDGHFESREEAVARLADLKAKFPHAWIKKRD